MLHKTARERYNKLRTVFTRLKKHFSRDDLDDFIQTANSLREWIRQDSSLTGEQKAHLERFVVPESTDWQICSQIANQQKHVGHSSRRAKKSARRAGVIVQAVDVKQDGAGFRVPQSMRIIGTGEEITIECDGHRESALGLVIRVFSHFHFIFEVAPIPPGQRTLASLTSDILN